MNREREIIQPIVDQAEKFTLPTLLRPVSVADILTNPAKPPEFVWDGLLPRGTVALMGAHGGTGKSTIALMLGAAAASRRHLFGVNVQPCKTVFVSLEDGPGIVRHRLATICRNMAIQPGELAGLHIVDGTDNPELFSAETRGTGATTPTFAELRTLVKSVGAGLVIVDNASDAFGGDEIQRRQVRAFMRCLVEIARDSNAAVLLLAHVDKATSRNRKAEGGEGYSGSTAWHNSARSRLFLTRNEDGTLTLEHQKSNLGKLQEPITLHWPDGGLPELAQEGVGSGFGARLDGRMTDDKAAAVLRLVAEYESRQQFMSSATTSRNHVYAVLRSDPVFQGLKLRADAAKQIVTQCQRAGWLAMLDYRDANRKPHTRWTVTDSGRVFADIPPAPTAPTAPTPIDGAHSAHGAAQAAPTAPTCVGGVGDSAHTKDGAEQSEECL